MTATHTSPFHPKPHSIALPAAVSSSFFTSLLPTSTPLRWVLGDTICYVSGVSIYIPLVADVHLILTLSIHRLLFCSYPLR